jgi:hypothetical protein
MHQQTFRPTPIPLFEELATRYKTLQEQFYAHEPKEGEDGLRRFLENHPMNTMVSDFLTPEQQSRGTQIGFSCLYHLVLAAGSVGDADYPVTKGKIAALDVLGQHYHHYPDIDTTFRYLFPGRRVSESKTFLRDLITSSRHGYVRANAMYGTCKLPCIRSQPSWHVRIATGRYRPGRTTVNEARMKHFARFSNK